MDINERNRNKIFYRISVDYNKSLVDILEKQSSLKIEDSGLPKYDDISPDLYKVEMNFLLDNIISPEQISKAIDESVSREGVVRPKQCEFCQKEMKGDICCENREIEMYLSNLESNRTLKNLSSYSLLTDEKFKVNKMTKILQQQQKIARGATTIKRAKELSCLKSINFEKHFGTFLRIKRKMQNIKKFYPEIYHRNESVIDMWARSDLVSLIEPTTTPTIYYTK